tara:strand:- start:2315 stop:2533 length:219 start_codon:yes stop_codon:yes gene_type:complete
MENIMNRFYEGYMAAILELREASLDFPNKISKIEWLKQSIETFINDPPDNSFGEGFLQLLIEELEMTEGYTK